MVCVCARAGFFLFAVQPFKLGDRVAVSYSTPAAGMRSAWFEGTCEKVDLRCAPPSTLGRVSPTNLLRTAICLSEEVGALSHTTELWHSAGLPALPVKLGSAAPHPFEVTVASVSVAARAGIPL